MKVSQASGCWSSTFLSVHVCRLLVAKAKSSVADCTICMRSNSEDYLGCSTSAVAGLYASLASLIPLSPFMVSLTLGMTIEIIINQASILSNFHAVKRELSIWRAVHIVDSDLQPLRENVYFSDLSMAASFNSDRFCRHLLYQDQYTTCCVSSLSALKYLSSNPVQGSGHFLLCVFPVCRQR